MPETPVKSSGRFFSFIHSVVPCVPLGFFAEGSCVSWRIMLSCRRRLSNSIAICRADCFSVSSTVWHATGDRAGRRHMVTASSAPLPCEREFVPALPCTCTRHPWGVPLTFRKNFMVSFGDESIIWIPAEMDACRGSGLERHGHAKTRKGRIWVKPYSSACFGKLCLCSREGDCRVL